MFTDLNLQLEMECGAAIDILQEWTSNEPLADMSRSFSNKVDSLVKNINTGVSDDSAFLQKYFDMQQVGKIFNNHSVKNCTGLLCVSSL